MEHRWRPHVDPISVRGEITSLRLRTELTPDLVERLANSCAAYGGRYEMDPKGQSFDQHVLELLELGLQAQRQPEHRHPHPDECPDCYQGLPCRSCGTVHLEPYEP